MVGNTNLYLYICNSKIKKISNKNYTQNEKITTIIGLYGH